MSPIGTKESEFTVFEDGTYEVGFGAWFPLDEQGVPNLVLQERFGEEVLVIRFRTTVNGEEGPPGSIEPDVELLPLVKAFGGDPKTLRDEKDIGRKLLKAQKMMTGTTKVTVGNGWIQNNSIEGVGVPEGFYYVRLVGITSRDESGAIGPIEGKYGPYMIGRVKITRGEFKDFTVPFFLDYPLVIGEDDIPALPLKSDGTLTASSNRFKNFLLAFYGADYRDFPHQDCEDVNNIMPLLTKMMSGRKLEALGRVDGRNRIDLNSLGPISDEEKELLEEKIKEGIFTEVQEALRMTIISEVSVLKNADAFVDAESWDLTDDGREWARETLAEGEQSIINTLGLSRVFSEWTDEQIEQVLGTLGYNKDGSKKKKKAEAQF
ncbi:MAG: hypothetical protein H8D67_30910 [Deltaproteobacteria bacterium]|nr:hypothetical protein [Deltaproteobacteria bacterium]